MPNHIHLIAVPSSEDGLRRAIGEMDQPYSADQLSEKGGRVSLAGAVRIVRDGRAVSACRRAVYPGEPGSSAAGCRGGGLA